MLNDFERSYIVQKAYKDANEGSYNQKMQNALKNMKDHLAQIKNLPSGDAATRKQMQEQLKNMIPKRNGN